MSFFAKLGLFSVVGPPVVALVLLSVFGLPEGRAWTEYIAPLGAGLAPIAVIGWFLLRERLAERQFINDMQKRKRQ